MTKHLDPAARVIDTIGIEKLKEITELSASQIYRWRQPRTRGGTDGRIPMEHAEKILEYCLSSKVKLDGNDLIRGAK